MILSYVLISTISQIQTQQVTSQIRSHIKYLNTYLLDSCTHFRVEIDEKSSHNDELNNDLMD